MGGRDGKGLLLEGGRDEKGEEGGGSDGKVGMMKGHKGGIVEGQESNVCLYERCEEAMAK